MSLFLNVFVENQVKFLHDRCSNSCLQKGLCVSVRDYRQRYLPRLFKIYFCHIRSYIALRTTVVGASDVPAMAILGPTLQSFLDKRNMTANTALMEKTYRGGV